jgi:DNA-binding MarR family transcriptional regulator
MTRRVQPDAAPADPEARVHDRHHQSLRLWLRLLTCTMMIERAIRAGLRERFSTTLPRFDLMAQLERHPAGLRMGELSRRLMVTNANVTGVTDQLVADGLVERIAVPEDRRAFAVRLTPRGKRSFDLMAAEHEQWIEALLAELPARERDALYALLGSLKTAVAGTQASVRSLVPQPPRDARTPRLRRKA